jgi:hypothetical protein
MSERLLRLNWRVDPRGYALVEYTGPDPLEAFRGPIDHRRVEPRSWTPPTPGLIWLVYENQLIPMPEDPQTHYEIGLGEQRDGRVAFIDLANMPATPEGVLKFTNHWGLLFEPVGAEVCEYYRASKAIRATLEHAKRGQFDEMVRCLYSEVRSPVDTRFGRRHAQRAPYLYFEISSLYQFCCLDLMHTYSRGADVKCCPGCGRYLPKHSKGRTMEYCSGGCRTKAWRRRKRAADTITATTQVGSLP